MLSSRCLLGCYPFTSQAFTKLQSEKQLRVASTMHTTEDKLSSMYEPTMLDIF